MKTPPKLAAALLLAALNAQLTTSFAQGSLTPPGAPAATMKTLAQIEPRTPIAAAPFTISEPGSYYLTTNLIAATGNIITITTNNITLDLNGFALMGGSTASYGVMVQISRRTLSFAMAMSPVLDSMAFMPRMCMAAALKGCL